MSKKMSFQELVSTEKPILIDFFAEWCGPCKAMGPILKEVAAEMGDQASIVKIDVDKNSELSSQLGIKGVPTLMVYKKGKVLWQRSGMQSANALTKVLKEAMTSAS